MNNNTRKKLSKALGGKSFVAIKDGEVIVEFISIRQAADFFKVNRSNVWEVLNGLRDKTRGVTFNYLEN